MKSLEMIYNLIEVELDPVETVIAKAGAMN